ncbi:MAG: maltose alpha-D-glucosyltransferase [Actinobacteria bacterium]|nr:maltose alpha-D-glucosyltransferase [Actinomycetota bacterium]
MTLPWYKDSVIYELHVRTFMDSDADGIGDFRGLTSRLDYLQDLGVTTIWLLPFYPSPLRDDGYDIANYTAIHPSYGTLRDFRQFLREAHRQGLRVITELVLNHTSDQHPWFQRARRAPPGSAEREFYVWSDTPDRYRGARIIFGDFESSNWSWDAEAQAYFWHRFYSHQPDLNYDNPDVQRAMFQVMDFWLDMGVDGMRLDAVPYLFEREGTNCENLIEGHDYLRRLRNHIDANYDDRMLLAEANQWPEDAVAYFGQGDECHMAFHFPLMPRMFMALRMEDRFPMVDILDQTPSIPDVSQWALFLRNHDELTLEMVTDEERDYMYRMYAIDPQARINLGIRRRLAPLLGNDRRMIEMMNGLLFSLPGTPVIYYGDEIGMGDNIYLGDRNGVRTPMQWSADRNAGFSRANPQRLYLPVIIDPEYHAEAVNVEAQQANSNSLLWWMKRLIGLRKRHPAFGRGALRMLYPENRKVLTFLRATEDDHILVVANLSRHAQYVELDLSAFKGTTPLELFGGTEFPRIGDLPYLLTLGPHGFYWFLLEPQRQERIEVQERRLPSLRVEGAWTGIMQRPYREHLEEIFAEHLADRRWFGAKGRKIKSVRIRDSIPVGPVRDPMALISLLEVEYGEGEPQIYVLPLTLSDPDSEHPPNGAIATLVSSEGTRVLYDAVHRPAFTRALIQAIGSRKRVPGHTGDLIGTPTNAFRGLARRAEHMEPVVFGGEQSNTSIAIGDALIMKLIRRADEGMNPDLEVGRFLTERTSFPHTPAVAGALEIRRRGRPPITLGILQGFVPNEGDAWKYTIDELRSFIDRVLARSSNAESRLLPDKTSLLDLAGEELPEIAREEMGTYLESASLLGRRTAELHLALASNTDDPAFAPEPFNELSRRSLYQSLRGEAGRTMNLLRRKARQTPALGRVLDLQGEILDRFHKVIDEGTTATRIRCHGDYHLGQVLFTGKDFVIIDFEGEPARPLGERRIKRSPLSDVAGLIRSFDYAAATALGTKHVREEDRSIADVWARFWYVWSSATFLRSYFATTGDASFIPRRREEIDALLDSFLISKALYEVSYEINHRPDWMHVPVRGLLELLDAEARL